jgi:hypothetical protein
MLRPSLLLFASLTGISSAASAQIVWHVDAAAAPGGNGTSWTSAFDSIDVALSQVVMDDSIWVKAGSYMPTVREDPNDPRSATFLIPQGIHFYGGFDGTETVLSERAGLFEQTILTGDRGVPTDYRDNVYHVVRMVNYGGPVFLTTIDGFTIRDGYGENLRQGAGLQTINCFLLLGNCTFRNNRAWKGGGLSGMPGKTIVRHCRFIDNRAGFLGGAIWGQMLIYKISNCVFRGNVAQRGGAVFFVQSQANGWRPLNVINNSLFHDNAAIEGGAIFLGGSAYMPGRVLIANSTLAFNRAFEKGGGIRANTDMSVVPAISLLFNSVVWGNTAPSGPNLHGRHGVAYSNVEGGVYVGGGNLSTDPLFVNAFDRNLRLLPGSPCNDAGSIELVRQDRSDVDYDGDWSELVPIDLDGGRRFEDDPFAPDVGLGAVPIVDMGAYEL